MCSETRPNAKPETVVCYSMGDFQDIDTTIYKLFREKYLPGKIRYLIVAESPPAFKGQIPTAYFYFDVVPKADSLFYTIIKAVYDLDFDKYLHSRIDTLTRLKNDGYYLIDAVEYPINKSKNWDDIPNFDREKIIADNRKHFESHVSKLIKGGHIDNDTRTILIKETVYNNYRDHRLLNVINVKHIGFPKYIKDRQTIEAIKQLTK